MSPARNDAVPISQTPLYQAVSEEHRRHAAFLDSQGAYMGCVCGQYPQPSHIAHVRQAFAAWVQELLYEASRT